MRAYIRRAIRVSSLHYLGSSVMFPNFDVHHALSAAAPTPPSPPLPPLSFLSTKQARQGPFHNSKSLKFERNSFWRNRIQSLQHVKPFDQENKKEEKKVSLEATTRIYLFIYYYIILLVGTVMSWWLYGQYILYAAAHLTHSIIHQHHRAARTFVGEDEDGSVKTQNK